MPPRGDKCSLLLMPAGAYEFVGLGWGLKFSGGFGSCTKVIKSTFSHVGREKCECFNFWEIIPSHSLRKRRL